MPCKLEISTSSTPRPSQTTAPNSCPGRSAKHDCRPPVPLPGTRASTPRHCGPPSGSDPKLAQAVQRYLLTVFGYGCNLGPGQTARHAPEIASAQALRRIKAQHINVAQLEAATGRTTGPA